ncbi:cytochrome b [Massilia horti]|uniref:Cytochrome b n=1 Tax=Massilia horti TaxID=2562153 RepID=A0A4Y9SPJ7_9BURK|nr:cytochrome b [Massilia horti]TFW27164.1 cytochrome b [Massilia horti]
MGFPHKKIGSLNKAAAASSLATRYPPIAQVFHWVTAILVLIAFLLAPEESEQQVYDPSGDFGRQLHETLGLAVLGLSVLRVLWLVVGTRPEPPEVARWMGIASKGVQGVLYLLLFAVPLTAITGAWLEGHPLTLLGGATIAPMITPSHPAGELITEIHTWLGNAILWVAGIHAFAALVHHYFLKDGVLVSMLPRWFYRRR